MSHSRNVYSGKQRMKMQRRAGAILLASTKGKQASNKSARAAAKKTAASITNESLRTVKVKHDKRVKPKHRNTSKRYKARVNSLKNK